jgi:predicted amidophosphoribosyltransferase
MCVECAAKATADVQARRARRISAGRCASCEDPIRPGQTNCDACVEAQREKRKTYPVHSGSRPGYWELVVTFRCVKCMTDLPRDRKHRMCDKCKAERTAYESARYHRLAKRGLCGRCGAINETHRKVCARCVRP